MQKVPNLHRKYSPGGIIWGSGHPTEENILLLKNIDMYNYTAVLLPSSFCFLSSSSRCLIFFNKPNFFTVLGTFLISESWSTSKTLNSSLVKALTPFSWTNWLGFSKLSSPYLWPKLLQSSQIWICFISLWATSPSSFLAI